MLPQHAAATPAGMGSRKAGFYRHDLDGLRGVAILLVAAFHIWFGRVSGGVDVFLVLSGFFFGGKLLRNALERPTGTVPAPRAGPAGASPAARAGGGAGRVGGADDPHPAADPLGGVRRPEPGQPGLLPELGAGLDGVELPEGRRGGQSAAAHLVDVGAGPVLPRVPAGGVRRHRAAAPPAGQAAADLLRGSAQRADHRVVRVRDLRPSGRPVHGLLQQLRARVGVAGRRAGRGTRRVRPVADVAADRGRDDRSGGHPVVRLADRRRQAVSRAVGAGAGRCHGADDPGGGQPAGRSTHPRQDAAAQPGAGAGPAGDARLDGLLAVSVALAAADLLAGVDRPQPRQLRGGRRDSAGVGRAGVSDDAVRRGTAALPGPGARNLAPRPR